MTAAAIYITNGTTLDLLGDGTASFVASYLSDPAFATDPNSGDTFNTTLNGTVYFIGSSADGDTNQLYAYNGTDVATINSTAAGDNDIIEANDPSYITSFDGDVLYSLSTDGGVTNNLLAYDPTNQTTSTVLSGQGGHGFVSNAGTLYFAGDNGGIYAWTGTGTATLLSSAHTVDSNLAYFNGAIYFGASGGKVYELDTANNSETLVVTVDNSLNAAANDFIVFNNKLYFDGESTGVFSLNTSNNLGTIIADAGASTFIPVVYTGANQLVFQGFSPSFTTTLYSINASGTLSTLSTGAAASANDFVQAGGTLYFDNGSNIFSYNGSSISTLSVGSTGAGQIAFLAPFSSTTWSAACYRAGTRIATPRGDIAVEALAAGDLVNTLRSGPMPVKWLGHRRIDCRKHPRPRDVWPVRVRADAFGPGRPHRDLLLSPDHAVFVDDVLIPIRYLLNGSTIAQEPAEDVTYWHVELDRHDILLAEGLPAESYLDTGNRGAFANGGPAPIALHPDFALRIWETESCAKLVVDGAALQAVRCRLLERARLLGHVTTDDARLRLIVDGHVLRPVTIGGTDRFRIPPTARSIRLRSRRAVPAQLTLDSDDHRPLGVAISRIAVDGKPMALDDPRLGQGWHACEAQPWRWTDGEAVLAIGAGCILEITVAITARYWLPPLALCAA